MDLAVFEYIDKKHGALHCCCLNSDYELYFDLVVVMGYLAKGLSPDRDDAIQDCVINLALLEGFSEIVEFKVIHKNLPKVVLH